MKGIRYSNLKVAHVYNVIVKEEGDDIASDVYVISKNEWMICVLYEFEEYLEDMPYALKKICELSVEEILLGRAYEISDEIDLGLTFYYKGDRGRVTDIDGGEYIFDLPLK